MATSMQDGGLECHGNVKALHHPSLSVRLAAVEEIERQLKAHKEDEINQEQQHVELGQRQLHRQCLRCATALLQGHYVEKVWLEALKRVIGLATLSLGDFGSALEDFTKQRSSSADNAKMFELCNCAMTAHVACLSQDGRKMKKNEGREGEREISKTSYSFPTWFLYLLSLSVDVLERMSHVVSRKGEQELKHSISVFITLIQRGGYHQKELLSQSFSILLRSAPGVLCRMAPLLENNISLEVKGTYQSTAKGALLLLYRTRVIESRQSNASHVLDNFGCLLSTLTPSDLSNPLSEPSSSTTSSSLLESAVGMMKKAPESSSQSMASFFSHIQVDTTELILQGGAASSCLRALKASSADTRSNALSLYTALISKCMDASAFIAAVKLLLEALQGKGGPLTNAASRLSVLSALSESAPKATGLSIFPNSSTDTPNGGADILFDFASKEVLPCLFTSSLEKEIDENNRVVCAKAIAGWISACQCLSPTSMFLPENVMEKIKSLLKSTNVKHRAHTLLALNIAATSTSTKDEEGFASTLVPLHQNLIECVKEGIKTPLAAHTDALLSLRLLTQMATIVSAVDEAMNAAKLWSTMSSKSSFLYAKMLLHHLCPPQSQSAASAQMTPEDIINSATLVQAYVKIFVYVARIHPEHFPQIEMGTAKHDGGNLKGSNGDVGSTSTDPFIYPFFASSPGLVGTLLTCIHHPDSICRNFVGESIFAMSRCMPQLGNQFLRGLLCGLNYAATIEEEMVSKGRQEGNEFSGGEVDEVGITSTPSQSCKVVVPAPSSLSSNVRKLFESCKAVSQSLDASTFSHALLLCSHPYVCGGVGRFKSARRLWVSLSQSLPTLFEHGWEEEICRYILDQQNQSAKVARCAAHGAIALLFENCMHHGRSCVEANIFPIIATQLAQPDVLNLSADEIAKYMNPRAVAASLIASMQVKETDIKITNADRKGKRGAFGGDFVEDEDWAERVKREKVKKLNEAKAADLGAEMIKLQKEIDESNARVKSLVEVVLFALEAVESFSTLSGNNELLQSFVSQGNAIPALMCLLRSPLVEREAFRCISACADKCLEEDIALFLAKDLSYSLRLIATIVDRPLRPKETEGEAKARKYKELVEMSQPIVRLVKNCQTIVFRMGPAKSPSISSSVSSSAISSSASLRPSTIQMLVPVLQGVLSLPNLLPGAEASWMVLESIWPKSTFEHANLSPLRNFHASVIEVCLSVLFKFSRLEPSADKVLYRLTSQVSPLSHSEWLPLLGSQGLLCSDGGVRLIVLKAIHQALTPPSSTEPKNPLLLTRLWVTKYDEVDEIRQFASEVWDSLGGKLNSSYYPSLSSLLIHDNDLVRKAAAKAIAGAIAVYPESAAATIEQLEKLFREAKPLVIEKKVAGGGTKISTADDTQISTRVAVARVFTAFGIEKAGPETSKCVDIVLALLDFILAVGVVDSAPEVRSNMLDACRSIVEGFGVDMSTQILSMLETLLAKKANPKVDDVTEFDLRHEAAVVLLGSVGRHLGKDDAKLMSITDTMIQALKTPSESVQKAVADCLVSLVQILKNNELIQTKLEGLMDRVMNADSYGERRGAAFGISAFVKGLGIPSLRQHDIVNRAKDACTDGSVNSRQGALFVFECLSERLGLLFEPYVINIVPALLKAFSHSSDHVRDAAQIAAKVIMGKLSAHGVKQVLSPILSSLPEEKQWKTRQESIRLLGTMAHCAPRQLSSCLPQVVPRLVEALSDPHPKVKEAAKGALQDITSVIRNPEVLRLSPTLLAALGDPSNKTKEALEALLECEFMHSIDAASLAIMVPILSRALKDRGADLKRKASAITGNMMTMVSEPKALTPYLGHLLPGLKDCLVDPIPDVRATSAKAIGSLVRGGNEGNDETASLEDDMSDIVSWLMDMLRSEASPVERSGAAQGLSETCLSLGTKKTGQILQTVLPLQNQSKSSGREGLLWLLSFLPAVLKETFAEYIGMTLPVVLAGLCDDNEGVREVAMRAGQVYVSVLGRSHTLEILPSLSEGMFHDDWRIRDSSVVLLGELLYLIGDTKAIGLADAVDDDAYDGGFSSSSRVIISIRAHVGDMHTDAVLASLYIARSDTSSSVRQHSLQVWKSIVSNSPRTLVEIMDTLVTQLIEKLSSNLSELRVVAGRALGEVVRKLGDRVLPAIVPHLQRGLAAKVDSKRQGVCLGLAEILGAASTKQVLTYLDVLVPALHQALCDTTSEVRSQAGRAFQSLYKNIGTKAVDEIIPPLLSRLSSSSNETDEGSQNAREEGESESSLALEGLREVVLQRPRDLIEYLVPKLLTHPMQVSSSKALGAIAAVAGSHLNFQFSLIIPSLALELALTSEATDKLSSKVAAGGGSDASEQLEQERERFNALKTAAAAVVGAVQTNGVGYLTTELGKQIECDTDVRRRIWGSWLTEQLFRHTQSDLHDYIPLLLKYLLSRVAELDNQVLQAVSDALLAMSNSVPLEELITNIEFIRNCINSTASDARFRVGSEVMFDKNDGSFILPLFAIPKSVEPLLNIFIFGVMNGSTQVREMSADAIGELAAMSDPNVLKPYLIKTTGPLIRVVGDRFPSEVKAAILRTLGILLDKGSVSLKAFAPQLQTTFVKSLQDPWRQVRSRACDALGKLMALTTRIDPLLTELCGICSSAESSALRSSSLDALSVVLTKAGDKAGAGVLEKCKTTVLSLLLEEDDNVRAVASLCTAALSMYLDAPQINDLLRDLMSSSSERGSAGTILGVAAVLCAAAQRAVDMREEAFSLISSGFSSPAIGVRVAAASAVKTLLSPPKGAGSVIEDRKAEFKAAAIAALHFFAPHLAKAAGDEGGGGELQRISILAIKQAAKQYGGAASQHSHLFMTPLAAAVKGFNLRVINAAQRALKHLLSNQDKIAAYEKASLLPGGGGVDERNFIRDYYKRIVSQLGESDGEED